MLEREGLVKMGNRISELNILIEKFGENNAYYHDSKKHYNEHSCRIEYIDC